VKARRKRRPYVFVPDEEGMHFFLLKLAVTEGAM
jgi:hypothetical protein